ncbi:MAG: DUF5686 family protein [Balneolaceae bacterium]
MSLKIKTFILLLLLFPVTLSAQQTIRGIVLDAESNEPLPSANILIEDSYTGTITNREGEFILSIEKLPATLIFRYIGYQTETVRITEFDSENLEVKLKPAVVEMDEIVVTEKDPGLSIMELVIERKKIWREELKTYQANAYTRQSLENDTSIVSITESVSEVFWDREKGHREIIKSRSQTSNIAENQNFAGVNYLPNFYDDNIEIAGFNLVGVTHTDALKFYDFKLLDVLKMDDKLVYEIEVTPKRKLQPTFEGTVYVLDQEYALIEVKLKPNRVVNFPPPVQDFNLSYEQQFNNFGGDAWLPVDMRIKGDVLISMIGLRFPSIRFNLMSAISGYKINTELPDTLYQKKSVFSVDTLSVQSDSLIQISRLENIPLTKDEEAAYAEIDSTQTLKKAFRPSGFLADMVMDDDNESGSNLFSGNFGNVIPDGFALKLHFNRADGFHLGGRYERKIEGFNARGFIGFNTNSDFLDYGGSSSRQIIRSNSLSVSVFGNYSVETNSRYGSLLYTNITNSFTSFFGARDYFDYFRSEQFTLGAGIKLHKQDLNTNIAYHTDYQKSFTDPDVFDYSLFGFHETRRVNPGIDDGTLRSLRFDIEWNYERNNYGFTGRRQAAIRMEHSDEWLNSDFSFTTGRIELDYNFRTFFPRRLFANTLDVHVSAGTSFGTAPLQRFGSIDGSVAGFTPFGVLKTLRHLPYEGDEYWLVAAEHNFRSVPFEWLGLWKLADRGMGIIVFGGAGKTRLKTRSEADIVEEFGFRPRLSDGIHTEAGISLNNIFSIARLDFAKRLDSPGFFVGFSVPRIF